VERITDFVSGIVDSRFPDLTDHHGGVAELAVNLAKQIGCSFEKASKLSIAARAHDIGKLSISEHILNKVSRLTHAEISHIRQHAELGYNLLTPLRLGTTIENAVLHHHENFDGSGYPGELKGESIPLFARILRICDSFDALTANRPYHQGATHSDALTKLNDAARWYDPELLKSFCGMMDGKGK